LNDERLKIFFFGDISKNKANQFFKNHLLIVFSLNFSIKSNLKQNIIKKKINTANRA